MTSKFTLVAALAVSVTAATLLTGCEDARKALTQTKAAPDEFEVYTRAPLTMPPDYGLRPPSDGRAEVEADDTKQQARRVLLNNAQRPTQAIHAATPGTSALLARAGAQHAEPGIRDTVERETSAYAQEDLRFLEKLMYGDEAAGQGTPVDPVGESKRIQEKQALGRPLTEGETPVIETKPKAPLEGLFDGWFN